MYEWREDERPKVDPEAMASMTGNSLGSLYVQSSTLPRALIAEFRQKRMLPPETTGKRKRSTKSKSPGRARPKGCVLQMGSGFRGLLILVIMVGVSSILAYWLYYSKLRTSSDVTTHESNIQPNRVGKSLNVTKLISDSDPDLYIDFDGNLHPLSDLNANKSSSTTKFQFETYPVKNNSILVLKEKKEDDGVVKRETEENGGVPPSVSITITKSFSSTTLLAPSSYSVLSSSDDDFEGFSTIESVQSKSHEVLVVYGQTNSASESSSSLSIEPSASPSIEPSAPKVQYPAIQTFTVGGAATNTKTLAQTRMTQSFDSRLYHYHLDDNVDYVTETVTGFLDFVTTIGNTVMIFTPQKQLEAVTETVQPVTPSKVATFEDEEKPAIGIEELFNKFERPSFPKEDTLAEIIKPSSVFKTNDLSQVDRVTTLSNGLIEVDGAIDDPVYDRASAEPALQLDEETYRIISTARAPPTQTFVNSKTLFSNFINGAKDVGVVTATGGTLIANGVTTVHSTQVLGSYMPNGQYVQVLASTSKVFNDDLDVKATPVQNFGTVQHVTERPSFGVAVAGQENEVLFGDEEESNNSGVGSVQVIDEASITGSRIFRRKSSGAINDFKERLKNRYQQFKKSLNDDEEEDANIGRGSVSISRASINNKPSRSGTRFARRERQRFRDIEDEEEEEEEAPAPTEAPKSFATSNRFRSKANRFRNRYRNSNNNQRIQQSTEINTDKDLDVEASSLRIEETTRFGLTSARSRGTNRFRTRNRNKSTPSFAKPSPRFGSNNNANSNSDADATTERSLPKIKKFSPFSRPDIRQSLLAKILNKGKANENTLTPEEQEEAKLEQEEALENLDLIDEEDPIQDGEALQDVQYSSVKDGDLQTTLLVSTQYPENLKSSSAFLEVATIRSPYSFSFEDSMSTRFITVTRTFTSTVKPSKTRPPSSTYQTSTPIFQTETIPAPENILTSSLPVEFNPVLDISSSIETLPAVVLASSTGITPPLKTVTETFSTKELMLKTSILPIVINGQTKHHTLTQSYYVTRLVEAVKTIPPMEAYEFIPTKAFTDFSNQLDEAGSEKREHLLPGELEFGDQDQDLEEGPTPVRVAPPPGFTDDLKLIGSKFDPVDQMEKQHNPEIVDLKTGQNQTPNLQSGFGSLQALLNPFAKLGGGQNTPGLPAFNPLGSLTPEQIQQLALLQYLQNPFGHLGGLPNLAAAAPKPAAVAPQPVLKTETLFTTKTLPVFFGNKKHFTTLTEEIGVTTVTEYPQGAQQQQTALPQPGALPSLPSLPQLQLPQFNQAAHPKLNIQPSFTVTSQPIVQTTTVPSEILKEVRITFRNVPTVTTLTSTTMVSTQITKYVTQTVPAAVVPSINQAFNPLAALLG